MFRKVVNKDMIRDRSVEPLICSSIFVAKHHKLLKLNV